MKKWPQVIEKLEKDLAILHEQLNYPAFYRGSKEEIRTVTERVEAIPGLIDGAYARWAELES